MNKENQSRHCNTSRTINSQHPSDQSKARPYKPSIKVGYQVMTSVEEEKKTKRRIEPIYNKEEKAIGRKMVEDTNVQVSGKFINSEYIKINEEKQPAFHRKGVAESRDKYQSGEAVKQQMNSQFGHNSSRRCSSMVSISSSRNKMTLPSYKNTGIKDIMEYHHALPYRETPVTEKCTKTTALSRFCKFSDLHEHDFRKRNEFLR